jgi:hypothetical protein
MERAAVPSGTRMLEVIIARLETVTGSKRPAGH